MGVLPLDSPRWHALEQAYGPASNVPGLLRQLREHPEDESLWRGELWGALYHQGTTYSASYAAMPHLVEVARAHPGPVARRECVLIAGAIALVASPDVVHKEFRAPYRSALEHARLLAREESVRSTHDVTTYPYLLAALAALSGWTQLGNQLELLASGELDTTCSGCGAWLVLHAEEAGLSISPGRDAAHTDGARSLPVEPAQARTVPSADEPSPWEQLLALSLQAGQSRAAAWLRSLGGTASCPVCAARFSLEYTGVSSH